MTIYCLKRNSYFISRHQQLWPSLWDPVEKQLKNKNFSSWRKIAVSLFLVFSVFSVCKTVAGLSENSWSKEASHLRSLPKCKIPFLHFHPAGWRQQKIIAFKSYWGTQHIHGSSNNKATPQITSSADLSVIFCQERLCDLSLFLTLMVTSLFSMMTSNINFYLLSTE